MPGPGAARGLESAVRGCEVLTYTVSLRGQESAKDFIVRAETVDVVNGDGVHYFILSDENGATVAAIPFELVATIVGHDRKKQAQAGAE